MTLAATLRVGRGGFALAAELDAADGEVVALLGPNGAGKTTALHALAGLVALDGGRVVLDGEVLEDPASRLRVAPERRAVGVVFQDYLLFPHLSALDNVAFGLRSTGTPRRQAREIARGLLAGAGLADVAGRRPGELSGGQAQRVALARALAGRPRLLLLDEPLAAVDARTRAGLRGELREELAAFGGSTLLVTHDSLDAMVLADRLVVLEDGAVVQRGTPAEVARRPRTDYVARLVGLNLYSGVARGGRVSLPSGASLVGSAPASGAVLAAFRPAAVSVHRARPDGSPRNVWPGRVRGLELHGDQVRVEVTGELTVLADVTTAAVAELGLRAGTPVWVSVKAAEVDVYPA